MKAKQTLIRFTPQKPLDRILGRGGVMSSGLARPVFFERKER